ncbi:MAG: M28 family metallopeptidase [Proteobacteria bacterium]|nr:M28 family metallopeptidase [Pseudomonadota bacterium]
MTARRPAPGACLLTALALVACAAPPPASVNDALDLIGQRALQKHVAYLASDGLEGRMTGRPGYDKAAEYVAGQLAAMGVEPAGPDGWYQPVPLRSYTLDSAEFTLHGEADRRFVYRDDFASFPDPVATESRVRAEVVYVGYGVHAPEFGYSDYEGIDVAGRIVAAYRGAPASISGEQRAYFASSLTKLREAAARGAVGAITLRSRDAEEKRPWSEAKTLFGRRPQMRWITDDGRAADHFPAIRVRTYLSPATAGALFADAPISYEASLDRMEAGEPASAHLGVEVTMANASRHTSISSPNVVGMVRGTDPALADEYVVYTAHLDHIGTVVEDGETRVYNGAYDNAMGVALMLETARSFAAFPPRRSLLFVALTAEERGLLGSDYFVNHPVVPASSIVANVNLDMPLFLYPVADLIAFGSGHSSLQGPAERAARAEGFAFAPDPMPEESLFVRSDQYSFVRKGIPALFLVPGFGSQDDGIDRETIFREFIGNHYHKPSDDSSRPVDWGSAVRFARAHARIGYAVAMGGPRPRWKEDNFFGERFARP